MILNILNMKLVLECENCQCLNIQTYLIFWSIFQYLDTRKLPWSWNPRIIYLPFSPVPLRRFVLSCGPCALVLAKFGVLLMASEVAPPSTMRKSIPWWRVSLLTKMLRWQSNYCNMRRGLEKQHQRSPWFSFRIKHIRLQRTNVLVQGYPSHLGYRSREWFCTPWMSRTIYLRVLKHVQ